ncbi:hypothetical protein [Streptomyces sp. NPDC048392]|uniref:hypothetical protein n=1 Tax=Streptomyces sp. NPDC048392 TaxID=3365543 RepID=UPI00371C6233
MRGPADGYDAHRPVADGAFAGLSAVRGPEHWSADGARQTPAGRADGAQARPRPVA